MTLKIVSKNYEIPHSVIFFVCPFIFAETEYKTEATEAVSRASVCEPLFIDRTVIHAERWRCV
jgi:hypothetical protein